MRIKISFLNTFLGFVGVFLTTTACWSLNEGQDPTRRVLVFSKTTGFRHIESISEGKAMLTRMGQDHGFVVDTTEDAAVFTDKILKQYQAIVFLNVSGELFNTQQRLSLKRYVQAGGGFLAIHASTDAERDWRWYGGLIGGYFDSHPAIQKASFKTVDRNLPGFDFLPDSFEHTDEFYNFQQLNPAIHALVHIDEKSYKGGNMGNEHPMVWYHEYDGGRSFYTALGHTAESYKEPLFLKVILAGMNWVMGGSKPTQLDYSLSTPGEGRLTTKEVFKNLDEPMQMAFAENGNIYLVERKGKILRYNAAANRKETVGTVPVNSSYEDGLLGIALDPLFRKNKWLYVFYTQPDGEFFRVARFTLNANGTIDLSSEKSLLEIPKQILDGSHTGGALMFDPRGTGDLYITVGDNSSPREWFYSPIDERPDKVLWDAQRSSGNTNDLRGKILRIHPEPNGSYTVPTGNLFPAGTPKTRPEIYSMGHRQPWRISMDTKTGWLYVGEVGPDARKDSAGLGPAGHDEFNQIRKPGNFGWPYFVGNNKAYWEYDFNSQKSLGAFRVDSLVNNSPNNTGLTLLPSPQSALIWYPYGTSKEFPELGTGGRSATGGPVFRKADFKNAKNTFPAYFEGKWFITDWMRGGINVVSIDEAGNYKSIEPFMEGHKFASPIDMQFGPDGSLYVLEYGLGWFKANEDARLVRIDYNPGNRIPVAKIKASKVAGAVPLTTLLSPLGSYDYDGDSLTYKWEITSKDRLIRTFNERHPTLSLKNSGTYVAKLTVTDPGGAFAQKSLQITAGNEPPVISINLTEGNQTFALPGSKIKYDVKVTDKEDGSLEAGTIIKNHIKFSIDYQATGKKQLVEDWGHQEQEMGETKALVLMRASDCLACHDTHKKSIGPTFTDIADKYSGDKSASANLVKKVINGGSGVWGQIAMSSHPDLKVADTKVIVDYILNLNSEKNRPQPLSDTFFINVPDADQANNMYQYVLKASYEDQSAGNVPSNLGKALLILRAPRLSAAEATFTKAVMHLKPVSSPEELTMFYGPRSYIGFSKIDLSDIGEIYLNGSGQDSIEVHMDSPEGPLIGWGTQILKEERSSNGKKGPTFKVQLKEVREIHDLYFVARGPTNDPTRITVTLTTIDFKRRQKSSEDN